MSLEGGASARGHRWVATVAFCAVALTPTGHTAAEDYGPDLETYRLLIERYQSGDAETPVRAAASWGPIWIESTVDRQLKALERAMESSRGRPDDQKKVEGGSAYDIRVARGNVRLAQGAFLLHTHAALAEGRLGLRSPDHDAHAEAAWRVLRWFRDRYEYDPSAWPEEARGLRPRDFYLALASAQLLMARPLSARAVADESLRSEGHDGEMRLVAGCAVETEALLRRRSKGHWSDKMLRKAEHRFGEALADDPTLIEAQLRLGWVLVRRGRAEEAQPFLETVAETPGAPDRRALAWLFLGRAHEERNDTRAAVEAYRRAVGIAPHFQAAHIALAHALEEDAGDEAARAVLAPYFLERSLSWVRNDPWNDYPFGPPEMRLRPFVALVEKLCKR